MAWLCYPSKRRFSCLVMFLPAVPVSMSTISVRDMCILWEASKSGVSGMYGMGHDEAYEMDRLQVRFRLRLCVQVRFRRITRHS